MTEPSDFTTPLTRPLALLDLETTGLSVSRDRIVELAILVVDTDGSVVERERRFNPGILIPPEATAVHGISNEDVASEATFAARARSLAALLEPCDLAGFNIRRFDLPILLAEFRKAEVEFDVQSRAIIDIQQIFHREEPRDLSAAARFYLGREAEAAHSALGDTRTSYAVFMAQLKRYPHLPGGMAGLHRYCDEVRPFETELDRWFQRAEGGLLFKRGKHRGRSLAEVAAEESDYLRWMLGAEDMDPEVLEVVQRALAGLPDPTQEALPLPPPGGSEGPPTGGSPELGV